MVTDFLEAAQVGEWVEGTGMVTGHDNDFYAVSGRIWAGKRTLMTATGVFKALGPRPAKRRA